MKRILATALALSFCFTLATAAQAPATGSGTKPAVPEPASATPAPGQTTTVAVLAASQPPAGGPSVVAQLAKVTGVVRVTRSGTEHPAPAVSGLGLYANDQIITLNGRAEVLFASGNILRLKNDTVLTVIPPADPAKKSLARTFAFLFKGSVRALVKSVQAEEGFAIRSPNAIASVKGTDLLFDGTSVQVRDEGDATVHQVDLSDPDGLHHVLVGEGMEGGFDPNGNPVDSHAADPAAFDRFEMDGTGGPGAGGPSGDQPHDAGQAGQGSTDTQGLHGEAETFQASGDLGDLADHDEHQGDVAAGVVQHDRHGNLVLNESHVFLENSNTIKYVAQTTRDGGDNKGTTTLTSELAFNQDLPPDHFEDVRRGLAAAFRDPTQSPPYYITEEDWQVVSPHDDMVRVQNLLGVPQPLAAAYNPIGPFNYNSATKRWDYSGLVSNATQIGWAQDYEYRLWLGSATGPTLKEHFHISILGDVDEGWYAGVTPPAVYPATVDGFIVPYAGSQTAWNIDQNTVGWDGMYGFDQSFYFIDSNTSLSHYVGQPMFNNPSFGSGTRLVLRAPAGSFVTGEQIRFGDGTTLTMGRSLIQPDGTVLDPGVLLPQGATEDLIHALPGALNYEVEFGSSEFDGRMIDILSPTRFWDDAAPHGLNFNGPGLPLPPYAG